MAEIDHTQDITHNGATEDCREVEDSTNKTFQKLERAVYGDEKSFAISAILSIVPGIGLMYMKKLKDGTLFLIIEIILLSVGYVLGGLPGKLVWIVAIIVWLLQIWQTFVKYNEYKEYFNKTGRAPW
ncbi:hypothetical protein [Candidatus Methanomassiliicoccus intestinalis]|jgi:hypothetical protein|uniref:Uncharacterized protein n=2 Tax=Candidatus Methanomassiliicoccus intestinalis TaxID=1406512 RepID=R9T647_METII|nr:hypothetical protein [Candidatus Methanomassiliicoccus intestinalis]AGN26165.1 hypothetical protein MMINT_08010 [Candidatus Methanomassiliicoccus intestinalis Issoire-Mx1]TQS84755.1 MAG: hypothetical protein A3207_01605 [Candidatus Methanomassiliicoccus intestinalis]